MSLYSQAAAALESFSLDTPAKLTKTTKAAVDDELPLPFDDRRRSVSPATLSEVSEKTEVPEVKVIEAEPYKKSLDRSRFVGDIDLPECTFHLPRIPNHATNLVIS